MNAWMGSFGEADEHAGCGNLMSRITVEGAEQSGRRPTVAALSGKSGRAKSPVNRTGRSIAGKPDQAS
jgi:hypothetical protein